MRRTGASASRFSRRWVATEDRHRQRPDRLARRLPLEEAVVDRLSDPPEDSRQDHAARGSPGVRTTHRLKKSQVQIGVFKIRPRFPGGKGSGGPNWIKRTTAQPVSAGAGLTRAWNRRAPPLPLPRRRSHWSSRSRCTHNVPAGAEGRDWVTSERSSPERPVAACGHCLAVSKTVVRLAQPGLTL